jgi:ATP-dependent DNA helicase RecG
LAWPNYTNSAADSPSEEAIRRLEAFAKTTDGFQLADIDFKLRGPGELMGTRQHGLPPLRIADLRKDGEILVRARSEAKRIVSDDPVLKDEKWQRLRRQVLKRYGQDLQLGDVG